MFAANDSGTMEYATLMERARTIERTAAMTWTIATTAATALLAWAIADDSPGRLLAAVLAAAAGLYPMIHARQQLRLIAGYVEESIEGRTPALQWHTKLGRLRVVPAVNPADDWMMTLLSNLVVVAAVVFSWVFAGSAGSGAVIAGFVTACGVALAMHSVMETARIAQTDYAAVWRKVSAGPRESDRPGERLAR